MRNCIWKPFHLGMLLILILAGITLIPASVLAFTIQVLDSKTGDPIGVGYRWLVEQDATHAVAPNDATTNWATKFHRSYMPLVRKGHSSEGFGEDLPPGRYYVSVLPDQDVGAEYSIGGAQFLNNETATVYVTPNPIPTARISVLVFHDNNPINAAPDLPEEAPGLGADQTDMSGFTVKLEDAGGRYGASAGEALQDALGNPIGTTYDQAGNVVSIGNGFLTTGPDGEVIFQNMAPGKYGVIVIPPAGQGWQQTSTIEGKKVIDAWVKANEPAFFAEFGPPGWHAFVGFIQEFDDIPAPSGNTVASVSGTVVNNHLSRPPDTAFYDGAPFPHTTPWVGLNANGGLGPAIAVQRTNGGAFSFDNVPPGDYQLAIFDDNMDLVFNFKGVTVNGDGSCATPSNSCNMGNVPTFDWFTKIWTAVFNDENEDGFWDEGESGLLEAPTALRWRDGTLYQEFPTDGEGWAPYDEVFPFFSWLTAEVGFGTLKATGATVVVDDGGAIDPLDPWTFGGQLNPQAQPETGGAPYRVETGPVLAQAFQGFLGQTSVIHFGKTTYDIGQNGGVSGIVYYSTTRAENDPELGGPEPWEPGIPNVEVNLYDSTGTTLLATTLTDSWDDNLPTQCPGDNAMPGVVEPNDCFDGMRNWNQVRPGVFDGGYAFGPEIDCNPDSEDFIFASEALCLANTTEVTDTDGEIVQIHRYLNPAEYVVEVVPPLDADGAELYAVVKSQDKNVDFGDTYTPQPELLPAQCVNWSDVDNDTLPGYTVPTFLTLFPGVDAPLAGQQLPLCDRKLVALGQSDNAAADFFLFTEVPIAAHIVGGMLDDTANEFDPNSPQFGEKFAPPWLPVGIYDWTGRLIGETISDQYGRFNALAPSTYTQNLPMPSGTSPNMLTTCMNDPSGLQYGGYHNPQYSTFCYTFQYMPGATTYLDTPVVPVAAFAGPDQDLLDCELPDGTPKIFSVSAPTNGVEGGGPYIPTRSVATGPQANRGEFIDGNQTLVITSMGTDPNNGRDYGFGSGGTVSLGDLGELTCTWNDSISCTIPDGTRIGEPGAVGGRQLTVTRTDSGLSTVSSVTVQVGLRPGAGIQTVAAPSAPGAYPGAIQQAIDAAGPNDLILVSPGTYNEFVIMYKPVQLQGQGAGSTEINAVKAVAAERLTAWRAKVEELVTNGAIDLLPGQEELFGGIEPVTFFTEEGAGVLVVAQEQGPQAFGLQRLQGNNAQDNRDARIDGFTIRGADQGSGIVASGYVDWLDVSNNVIKNNSGFFGGGFRSGHPHLDDTLVDSENDNIHIHHNMITQNGGLGGAGGGVSLCTGSDGYQVTDNFICGNFALTDGGGIGHLGLSDGGRIANNDILFNQSFNQGLTVHGGGILIAGGGVPAGQLTPGSGSVVIEANLILGNQAGAGDGGGVALVRVNGEDVAGSRNDADDWYGIDLFDNIITNNMAALAGGGIVLRDTVKANIIHNTVVNNDTTATAGNAFSPGEPNISNPQPAGIVSRTHSNELNAAVDNASNNPNQVPAYLKEPFANPQLVDTIVWQNRSFYFAPDPEADPPLYQLLPDPAAPVYRDLAVLPAGTGFLSPDYCVLTSLTDNGHNYNANNIVGNPLSLFIDSYFNTSPGQTIGIIEPLFVAPAFDEGGNFIQVRFGPLTLEGTSRDSLYHINGASAAFDAGIDLTGTFPALSDDFDGDPRSGLVDIGADEAQ